MSESHTAVPSAGGASSGQPALWETKLRRERLLVLAPHMDDETLGCGGTIAQHSDRSRVHCLFATDGSRSPAPLLPWTGRVDPQLPARRRAEAIAALAVLGVSSRNLVFLDLPDGKLARHKGVLTRMLQEIILSLRPEVVLAPFRLDAHPDHVTLNTVTRSILRGLTDAPLFAEYFVYNRLRLLPGGDVRRWLQPSSLVQIPADPSAAVKLEALLQYQTQTTITQPWQERPILTPDSLRERSGTPECFLFGDPGGAWFAPFPNHRIRIFVAYLAQRYGKRPKDRVLATLRWLRDRGPAT